MTARAGVPGLGVASCYLNNVKAWV